MPAASAHRSQLLGADEGDQVTPIGVTQPAQGTNLELIIRPWSQVAHRYRLRTGQRHVHPNGRSARHRYGTVTQVKRERSVLWRGLQHHLSAVGPAIDILEASRV